MGVGAAEVGAVGRGVGAVGGAVGAVDGLAGIAVAVVVGVGAAGGFAGVEGGLLRGCSSSEEVSDSVSSDDESVVSIFFGKVNFIFFGSTRESFMAFSRRILAWSFSSELVLSAHFF